MDCKHRGSRDDTLCSLSVYHCIREGCTPKNWKSMVFYQTRREGSARVAKKTLLLFWREKRIRIGLKLLWNTRKNMTYFFLSKKRLHLALGGLVKDHSFPLFVLHPSLVNNQYFGWKTKAECFPHEARTLFMFTFVPPDHALCSTNNDDVAFVCLFVYCIGLSVCSELRNVTDMADISV